MHEARRARDLPLRAAALALGLATAASYLGGLHWITDLLTHFRVQLGVVSALLVALSLLRRQRRCAAAAALCLVAHAVPAAAYALPAGRAAPADGPSLRLLLANVHIANRRHERVAALIRRERPDVVGLLEVGTRWLEALEELGERYPHRIANAREDPFGIALFSRFPLDDLSLPELELGGFHAVRGRFVLGTRPTTLVLAHPVPPVGGRAARLRDRQLAALAAMRAEDPESEFILLGDLNASPWSAPYRRLEASAGLANAARGLGWLPTWPVWAPALRIPIDHCLLSPGLRATAYRLGPDTGSDHFPLVVDVALRRSAERSSRFADGGLSGSLPPRARARGDGPRRGER